jgi:hypothetical protein
MSKMENLLSQANMAQRPDPAPLHLDSLPMEMQLQIFQHLDFRSALTFCALSRRHRATFHPRLLPAAEKTRFIREAENYERHGGPWRTLGAGCFDCCRVRPEAEFARDMLWYTRGPWRGDGPMPENRVCVDCGVRSGLYPPGRLLYAGLSIKFVCVLCHALQHQAPRAKTCRKDLICATCWAERGAEAEASLCTFCKINRAREKAEERLAVAGRTEAVAAPAPTAGEAPEPAAGQPTGRVDGGEDSESRGGWKGRLLALRPVIWAQDLGRGIRYHGSRKKQALALRMGWTKPEPEPEPPRVTPFIYRRSYFGCSMGEPLPDWVFHEGPSRPQEESMVPKFRVWHSVWRRMRRPFT